MQGKCLPSNRVERGSKHLETSRIIELVKPCFRVFKGQRNPRRWAEQHIQTPKNPQRWEQWWEILPGACLPVVRYLKLLQNLSCNFLEEFGETGRRDADLSALTAECRGSSHEKTPAAQPLSTYLPTKQLSAFPTALLGTRVTRLLTVGAPPDPPPALSFVTNILSFSGKAVDRDRHTASRCTLRMRLDHDSPHRP